MKNKKIAYLIVVLLAVTAFALFLLFKGKDEQYNYVPFIIGFFSVLGIYLIKNHDKKPDEWGQ